MVDYLCNTVGWGKVFNIFLLLVSILIQILGRNRTFSVTLDMALFHVYGAHEGASRVSESLIVENRQYLLYSSAVNS